jgi:hypothetical protein
MKNLIFSAVALVLSLPTAALAQQPVPEAQEGEMEAGRMSCCNKHEDEAGETLCPTMDQSHMRDAQKNGESMSLSASGNHGNMAHCDMAHGSKSEAGMKHDDHASESDASHEHPNGDAPH